MIPRAILFIESNTSGTGVLFFAAARALGYRPVLVTARPRHYAFLTQDDAPEVLILDRLDRRDRLDEERLVRLIDARFASRGLLAAITTSSEYFVPLAATLARRFGLPGPEPARVREARDKSRQRDLLSAAGLPTPAYETVGSAAAAAAAARMIGAPVVVKPVDGSGSMGVRLCATPKEAERHASALLAAAAPDAASVPRVLVEAFIDGDEYSVEVFAGRILGITRKHLGAPPHFVESGHDYPAAVSDEAARALRETVARGTACLGLAWGPLHWELRVRAGLAYPMEVNPRLAGGYIPELVRCAQGIDLIRETLRLALGERPDLRATRREAASIRFLLPTSSGQLAMVTGLDAARSMPWVVDARLYRAPGDELVRHGDFRDRAGHIIAAAPRVEQAASAAIAARELVRFDLREALEPVHA